MTTKQRFCHCKLVLKQTIPTVIKHNEYNESMSIGLAAISCAVISPDK